MRLKKPDLSRYDVVIVVENGSVTHVASTKGGPFDVLVVDRDISEVSNPLWELPADHPAQDEAAKLIQELAEEAEELTDAYVVQAEEVIEVKEEEG